jgi:hypothetical protein
MLPTASSFKDSLLALSPTKDQAEGVNNFVNAVADFSNQVQAGSTGTPGILTFGNSAMVAILLTQHPVKDSSWIMPFANAWEAGILASVITPGTVTGPAWIGSVVDVDTLPSAADTITTLSAAKAILISGLGNVAPTSDAPLPLATAIRNATLALTFNCIGLGAPPDFTPIPIPIPAE